MFDAISRKLTTQLGDTVIGDIFIDRKSRDNIPTVLQGMQWRLHSRSRRKQVFELMHKSLAGLWLNPKLNGMIRCRTYF